MGIVKSAAKALAKKVVLTAAVVVGKRIVDKLAEKAAERKVQPAAPAKPSGE